MDIELSLVLAVMRLLRAQVNKTFSQRYKSNYRPKFSPFVVHLALHENAMSWAAGTRRLSTGKKNNLKKTAKKFNIYSGRCDVFENGFKTQGQKSRTENAKYAIRRRARHIRINCQIIWYGDGIGHTHAQYRTSLWCALRTQENEDGVRIKLVSSLIFVFFFIRSY